MTTPDKLLGNLSSEMADNIASNLMMGTCTNTTAEAKAFTMKDLHKARFSMMGFDIQENPMMPDNCIAFVPNDKKDVIWYNMETGKMYHMDTKKILDDMWGDMTYDPTR